MQTGRKGQGSEPATCKLHMTRRMINDQVFPGARSEEAD